MKWSSNLALNAAKDVAYNYSYDAINRITGATYLSDTGGTWANSTGQYSESGYHYDQNGNISNGSNPALIRKGAAGTTIDNLTYSYGALSNQLTTVSDAGGDGTKGFIDGNTAGNDYAYDGNGNMVTDKNKLLTATNAIVYNHLNLPAQVIKNTNEKIVYTYDAFGRKLTQQVYNAGGTVTKTTEYDGEFIYQGDTLQFINHEEGRIVMKTGTPEYQYHLKDHLGNVRLTFTSKILTQQNTATFETNAQATEAAYFQNYPSSSHINPVATNAHTGTNSLYLNGANNGGQVGVAKSFSVMPGDVVSIQSYTKYLAPTGTSSNLAGFATALLAAFNLPAPAQGEAGTARSAINAWGAGEAAGFGDGSTDNTDPRVFVTIIIFDRNYTFVDVAYQQLTSSGFMSKSYTVKQPGYAYMYVSNEQQYQTDVYFDDVMVTFTPSPVVQQEDFYPFGLTFNSYSREKAVPQNYLYNGKELQDELSLDWIDYGARMYMPETGRWGLPDPHAVSYFDWSPYSYVYDNPIFFVDPNGEDVDVSQLLKSSNGFYVLYNLLSSLSNVTGNNIGYKNGKLINNGANKDATGSKSAASYLDRLITSEGTIIVGNDNSRGSDANSGAGRNTINLNSDQIDGFIASTSKAGLGEETQGYGMTFFHESLHTGTGTVEYRRLNGIKDDDTNYSDNWSANEPKGAVENIVNGFRTEMKLPTREAYNSINHTNADGTLLYSTLDFKSNGKIISVNLMNMSSAEQAQRRWAPLNSYIKELFKKNK